MQKQRTNVIVSEEFSHDDARQATLVHGIWIADEQIREIEKQHGGTLVRNVGFSDLLNKSLWNQKLPDGSYVDALEPPETPAVRFIPRQLVATQFGIDVKVKWHMFIRVNKVFSTS